jgi:glycosyltransferase involved in cell wall biosynthesis
MKQTIGIFTYRHPLAARWDPDSIRSGITGSEEAVIYISKELASLGYQVTVFGSPPPSSVHSLPEANPRFISQTILPATKLDIGISWRMPELAAHFRNFAKTVYLWPHDVCISPLAQEQIEGFDDVLWISKWQRLQWISVNPRFSKFTKIFGNGICPEQFGPIKNKKNPYSCIYSSNYGRGLEILVEIWPAIKQTFPQATLDVYYGWQHWGALSKEKELYLRKTLPLLEGVCEHGLVGHEELNKAYENTSLWTYPCIMPEVFCITALRAQLSGTIPVVIKHSALHETVRHGHLCAQPEDYLFTLVKAMQSAQDISLSDREKMGEFVLKEFTWHEIAMRWKQLFEQRSFGQKNSRDRMFISSSSFTSLSMD